MKKRTASLLAIVLSFAFLSSYAQSEKDMSAFLTTTTSDANKLIGAYVSPLMKGLSYGMTSGWYNTAKAHKIGGVDLGVSIALVNMPTAEETFDPSKLGLSPNAQPLSALAPTIIGPKLTSQYDMKYTQANPNLTISQTINGPKGLDLKGNIGMNAIPVPIIQLGVGLIKSTDLKIRYLPEQSQSDSKIKMLGFGLMHDIKQHIPGVKMLPFDLSLLVAYNSITGSTSLVNNDPTQTDGFPSSANGKTSYTFNSWLVQALISKKIAVLTFYAGVGYAAVSSKASITGTFVLDQPPAGPPAGGPKASITDPFSSTYSNNGAKLTAGMRLKLGPIYFNGDYTVQKYNALTLGFGVAIR
jgi:hypothetical protein